MDKILYWSKKAVTLINSIKRNGEKIFLAISWDLSLIPGRGFVFSLYTMWYDEPFHKMLLKKYLKYLQIHISMHILRKSCNNHVLLFCCHKRPSPLLKTDENLMNIYLMKRFVECNQLICLHQLHNHWWNCLF